LVRGTLNVLEQAEKAGISKIVLTCSWPTTMDPSQDKIYKGITLSQNDWGTATEEEVLTGNNNPLWKYLATKILAERADWDFSLSLIPIPPQSTRRSSTDHSTLTSRPPTRHASVPTFIYALIAGEPRPSLPPQFAPFYCDIRDVARAHVRSLSAPSTDGTKKRFLICGGTFTWKDVVAHVAIARPELKGRLTSIEAASPLPGPLSVTNVSQAKEVLGMDEYIPWEKSVGDTLDCLLVAKRRGSREFCYRSGTKQSDYWAA
ncbi:hypothetical protein B0H19DRAFT_944274, partial [Mycena capillaripes]